MNTNTNTPIVHSNLTVRAIKKRSSARWYFRVMSGDFIMLDSRRDMNSTTFFSERLAKKAGRHYRRVMLGLAPSCAVDLTY